MGTICVLLILFNFCLGCLVYGFKKNKDNYIVYGFASSLYLGVFLFANIFIYPISRKEVEEIKQRYTKIQNKIETINTLDPKQKGNLEAINIISDGLEKDVIEMNKLIDKNKTYYNSFWTGLYYSREIGKLEKLKYVEQ